MNRIGRNGLRAGILALACGLLGVGAALAGNVGTAGGGQGAAGGASAAACPVPANAAALRAGMLEEVNTRRRASGLAPLRPSPALERAAAVIACDNSRRGRMDHVALREGDLRSRIRSEGYRFRSAAEALAHGYRAPGQLAGVWYNSAYHYPTLMTPAARETGIAVVVAANGAPWWAMISAQPR